MSEKKKIIITIARQYGSGGADTGKKLAEDLGISFYDKNILRMNSDESGIKESYFHLADEKAGNRLLYEGSLSWRRIFSGTEKSERQKGSRCRWRWFHETFRFS